MHKIIPKAQTPSVLIGFPKCCRRPNRTSSLDTGAVAESPQCGSTGCGRTTWSRDSFPFRAALVADCCAYWLQTLPFVGQVPDYITELLTPAASDPSRSSLRSSSSSNLIVWRARRKIGDRAFAVAAPRAWNRLPTELKIMRSTPFKRHLKTYLFSSVYGAS